MKKKLKELRAKKTRLEGEAAAKLKLITPETKKEDATRIEAEHAALTTQIQEVRRGNYCLLEQSARVAAGTPLRARYPDARRRRRRREDDGDGNALIATLAVTTTATMTMPDATDVRQESRSKKEARALRALLTAAGFPAGGGQGALVRALLAGGASPEGEGVLTRAQIAELVVIDNQARGRRLRRSTATRLTP